MAVRAWRAVLLPSLRCWRAPRPCGACPTQPFNAVSILKSKSLIIQIKILKKIPFYCEMYYIYKKKTLKKVIINPNKAKGWLLWKKNAVWPRCLKPENNH
jgi:hypothetical protein